EAIRAPVGDRVLDLARERGRHPLVGVDRQHPVALRKRQREILLRAEPMPVVRDHARAPLGRDRGGAIGAAGIDHDALVAERQTVETGADVRLLVSRDDDGAQAHHPCPPDGKLRLHLRSGPRRLRTFAGSIAERRTTSLVEWPGTRSTRTTSPPSASTTSPPTTSSLR